MGNKVKTLTGEGGFKQLCNGVLLNYNVNIDFDKRKRDFINLTSDTDIQLSSSRYLWKNLPPYLTSNIIETMLYFRGSLIAFKNGGVLKILPFCREGKLNLYGGMVNVRPISFNGREEGKKLNTIINVNGDKYESNKNVGVFLFDKYPSYADNQIVLPRASIDLTLNEVIGDTLARIQSNIMNSENKVVFYCETENQKRVFEEQINNAYCSGNNFIVMVKGKDSITKESSPFHYKVENETQKLFECYQSYMNIKCSTMGIKNGGAFNKKERENRIESQEEENISSQVLEVGYIMRKLFLKQLKETYDDDFIQKIEVVKLEEELKFKEEKNNDKENINDKGEDKNGK